jgi:hypothetical protein
LIEGELYTGSILRGIMPNRFFIISLLVLGSVITPLKASAVEFATVGARAAGMGGAGVAVTSDAYATYWNPA